MAHKCGKVERKGSVTRAELTDEIEMFKGNENVLIMKQTYAQKFQCSYFFNNYPFDTQVCWSNTCVPLLIFVTHRFRTFARILGSLQIVCVLHICLALELQCDLVNSTIGTGTIWIG